MSAEGTEYTEEDLDEAFLALDENEQAEIINSYDEADEWGDFNAEEKLAVLKDRLYIPEDAVLVEGDDDDLAYDDELSEIDVSIDPLAVEQELEFVQAGGEPTVAVEIESRLEIPGTTSVTMSGEGYESQYLNEIQANGSDGGNEFFPDAPPDLQPGGQGGTDEGEEPPLHIEIEAMMAEPTAQQFVGLRENERQMVTVEVLGETFEEMELHNFERELTGDQPFAYSTTLEFVEWREVEVDDGSSAFEGFEDGNTADEPADEATTAPQGSADDPEVVEMSEGEQNDYLVEDGGESSNAIFDTTAPASGAVLRGRGDGWAMRDLGWNAEENRSGITASGSGEIAHIFLGHGGDSGIVIQDGRQVEISRVNLQHSKNGIHVVEGNVGGLAREL